MAATPSEAWRADVAARDAGVDGADLDAGHGLGRSMASLIERTVQSMLETTPLRSPRQGTLPTPRTVMPSASISPTTAETLVVPISRPTTISELSKRPFIESPSRLLWGAPPSPDRPMPCPA